jgi:Uma2 family endonuclease
MVLRARVRFKADDIWDTPDDGKRYEVIDGELYVTPPPVPEHQGASGTLFGYLWQYVRLRKLGRVYSAPIGVVLDEESGLQPDLVYIAAERLDLISGRGIEGAPDLVVEILSPSTRARDRGIKPRHSAAAGVGRYWIVDPGTRSLEAYLLSGQYGPGSVFRPELFPGLEIPIDDLWS